MFFGTYEHTIDDKNRLTLPARFRDALGDGVVLTRGLDGSVDVYPRETWEMTRRRPHRRRSTRSRARRASFAALLLLRRRRGRARQAGPRARARRRSSSTRGSARTSSSIGRNDHLEIWDRAAWRST